MRFPLPATALAILDRLEACGYPAYLVGGCVRDDARGIRPTEYDICSAATPAELHVCLADERLLDTGIQHGTVTLVAEDGQYEITSFRSDGLYLDSRHPDSVRFSRDLLEDLQRRDFTVNAMAYSPRRGLVDPHGGMEDLQLKVLRAVGDPAKRFQEDALRILRGLRFAASLGFDIEADSYQAMLAAAGNLVRISRERIAKELNLLLLGAHAARTLRTYPRLILQALPQLQPMLHCPQRSRFHVHDVWEHSLSVLENIPAELPLRWAALLHDSGKPAAATVSPDGATHFRGHPAISAGIARDILEGLKQPRRLTEDVVTLVRYHDDRINRANLQLWLARLGPELFRQMVWLQAADLEGHAPFVLRQALSPMQLIEEADGLIAQGACLSLKDMKIDGRRLMALGYPEGPGIGEALEALLHSVLTGETPNEAEALEALALRRLRG